MGTDKLGLYQSSNNIERVLGITKSFPLYSKEVGKCSPGLSVVILNLDKPHFIIPLLSQLKEARDFLAGKSISFEVLIGDTGSKDKRVLDCYESYTDLVKVRFDLDYHFSKCNNILFEDVKYDKVLFLNNDIKFLESAGSILYAMVLELRQNHELGVLGIPLFFETGQLQHGGVDFFRDGEFRGFCHHPRAREELAINLDGLFYRVPAVTGAFMMIKSDLFSQIGRFSIEYGSECQDVDLCLRCAQIGHSVGILRLGNVVHFENGTRTKNEENWGDRSLFMRRWSAFIEAFFL